MKWLGLGDARLTDDGLASLAGPLTGIEHLNLRGTRVTDAGLAHLRRLPGLMKLYLENTVVTGAGFGTLAELGGVEELHLAGSQVEDGGIEPLVRLPKLTWLDLSGTRVTGRGVAGVGKIKSLRQLYLNRRPLTDDDMAPGPLATLIEGLLKTEDPKQQLEGLTQAEHLLFPVVQQALDQASEQHRNFTISIGRRSASPRQVAVWEEECRKLETEMETLERLRSPLREQIATETFQYQEKLDQLADARRAVAQGNGRVKGAAFARFFSRIYALRSRSQ